MSSWCKHALLRFTLTNFDQYHIYLHITDKVTISIFDPLPLTEFRFEASVTLTLPPKNIVHLEFAASESEFCMCDDAIV